MKVADLGIVPDPSDAGNWLSALTAPSFPRPTITANGVVYLSGPITGLGYQEARYGWREAFANQMLPGIKVLSPMRHEGHLAEIKEIAQTPETASDHFFSGSRIIVEKDALDIERSDLMVVNLLGAKRVSIGTVMEIGIAYAVNKKIVLVMEDQGNVHEHPFVTVPAALRLNNMADAVYAVNSLLSEGI